MQDQGVIFSKVVYSWNNTWLEIQWNSTQTDDS